VVISDLMAPRHEHVSLEGGCFALISGLPNPCRAVVFVHGWGGSPAATWYRFQELVDDEEGEAEVWAWWQEADLYFFSYESRRFSISEHAEKFLRFLDQVFPLRLISPLRAPDATRDHRYGELYLVGHSLGAVVLRESILDRAAIAAATSRPITRSTDLLNGQLRLFAPAMHGAKPSGWLGLAYHLLREINEIKPWLEAALESQPIVRQLHSESDKLKRLRDDTEKLAGTTFHSALVADVVYGEKEHIVERDKFRLDRIELPITGRNHTSVCKPDKDYRDPLQFVMRGKHA
jgi:pimeloyl-ACP methyl ester carboxylesterase